MSQTTSHILMVRPAHFGFNEETAASNAFQQRETALSVADIQKQSKKEFDRFVKKLQSHGIHVLVANDSVTPVKTDAVFPNNWITTHDDGTLILYPMNAPSRRAERNEDIIGLLEKEFEVKQKIHFESYEDIGKFLEGTGSMILDRVHKICYACLSPRTDLELLDKFCAAQHFQRMAFTAVDENGKNIYHTNVMMALAETFVVICLEAVVKPEERRTLVKQFEKTRKEIVEISFSQMNKFAGNMLQVRNDADETFLVMSTQAYQSLSNTQVAQIESHTQIIYSDISTIEKFGGGSARCMMAEIFLNKKR